MECILQELNTYPHLPECAHCNRYSLAWNTVMARKFQVLIKRAFLYLLVPVSYRSSRMAEELKELASEAMPRSGEGQPPERRVE